MAKRCRPLRFGCYVLSVSLAGCAVDPYSDVTYSGPCEDLYNSKGELRLPEVINGTWMISRTGTHCYARPVSNQALRQTIYGNE